MTSEKTKKYMGIFIAVAMAGSLIAAGFIYMDPDQLIEPLDPNTLLDAQPTVQTFEINFQTTVINELKSIRIAAETDSININDIDITIRSLDSVSRVSGSRFINFEEGWYYLSEIDLRPDSDIDQAIENILSLEYFNGINEVMKRATISVPEATTLYNPQLDLNRNFVFPYETSVALVSTQTLPLDEINVSGEITLRGNEIVSLELIEEQNFALMGENYFINKNLEIIKIDDQLFFEGQVDLNKDTDFFEQELKLIDEEANIFFFESQDSLSFFGQSKIENYSTIKSLFESFEKIEFSKLGYFELEEVFIPDLNQTITLTESEFNTQIGVGKEVGQNINLEIIINVGRDTAQVVQSIAN